MPVSMSNLAPLLLYHTWHDGLLAVVRTQHFEHILQGEQTSRCDDLRPHGNDAQYRDIGMTSKQLDILSKLHHTHINARSSATIALLRIVQQFARRCAHPAFRAYTTRFWTLIAHCAQEVNRHHAATILDLTAMTRNIATSG
ncbi:hypothetical protein BJ138DRAFT_1103351 [Hygrophoropsis aurantiaca]|uniref:Uncharacterized protein n=1 Tax=Hygrophoropsis aurantiaca TaxID=72124 RepID=A0ACB8A6G4_9AGAM|nr:hypothetical protein BJ138DRAFT_1103351 [Hygrophoropsis aurantiaca]